MRLSTAFPLGTSIALVLGLLLVPGSSLYGMSDPSQVGGVVEGAGHTISGASVQLYAAGLTGYGNGSRALLKRPIKSSAAGAFAIGGYTCPSPSSEVYVVATGGDPGLAAGTSNPAIALMAALGPCDQLGSLGTISVNEVTTIASVYALSAFMKPGTIHVGARETNEPGLSHAFASVTNLVSVASGAALSTTPAGNGWVPAAAINSLADALATCVGTDGSGAACASLFAATTPPGEMAPTDTLQATLNITMHPANQIAALYGLASAGAPYGPALTALPSDWAIAVNYTGGGLDRSNPDGLAIGASGEVWVTNEVSPIDTPSVIRMSNTGVFLSGVAGYVGGGLNGPSGIALDAEGSAWVTNLFGGNVVKISSAGEVLSGPNGFTDGTDGGPYAVAIDAADNAWVANAFNATVTELNSAGQVISGANGFPLCRKPPCPYATPVGLAFNQAGDAYIPVRDLEVLVKLSPRGGVLSGQNGFVGGLFNPGFAAVDRAGVVWVTSNANENGDYNAVRFNSGGAVLSTVVGGYVLNPSGIAIDGVGNGWVLSGTDSVLNKYDKDGVLLSGSLGFRDKAPFTMMPCGPVSVPQMMCPDARTGRAVAIDSSGNIWVTSSGTNGVSEYIGLAAPVVTPLTIAVRTDKLGRRP